MHPELTPGHAGCLIFDWDGTLVDSQYANYRAMADALEREAVTIEQDWFDARTGLSSAEMIHKLVNERQVLLTRPVEEIVAERDTLFLQQAHTVGPHPAILAVVEASKGRLPMAIASGGARHIIEFTLKFQPFHDAFRAVITRDDVERGKPAPDIFLTAARALGLRPERCLVYEDSDEGITAAHAAGMRVIDVRPFT
jgi:beta-phosphoglucomutase-like phosphatase (HAD superfamily)